MQRKGDDDPADRPRARTRQEAPKEKVLHTRVPAVLEEELKRLADSLRVPVSNVVRAILEDAVDAVDTVSERAEGGLLGFVERLSRQRDELRSRVTGRGADEPDPADGSSGEPAHSEAADEDGAPCPREGAPASLDGVLGYHPLRLAAPARCAVCDRALFAGEEAQRAIFDDPGRRAFLGPSCRLVPARRLDHDDERSDHRQH